MQRNLRGLAHRADEQADADRGDEGPPGHRHLLRGELTGLGKDFGVIQRTRIRSNKADTEQEPKVAHTIDQERLEVRVNRCRPLVPEADQQVGHQAHRFPAEEQLQEVVRHHQHQHREGEQRDVAEEALIAWIFRHITNRVDSTIRDTNVTTSIIITSESRSGNRPRTILRPSSRCKWSR